MPDLIDRDNFQVFNVSIAGVGLRVEAPENVVGVVRSTLSKVPSMLAERSSLSVSARQLDDMWEVTTSSGSRKMLDSKTGSTQVAGAVVSSAVSEVANAKTLHTMRATVVEIGGAALVMIGSDWEATVTIATHLHTRGWRYLSGDHSLYDPTSNEVLAFEKSLYVTSSSLGHLPIAYRGAIEASPWCVTRHGISFYAVDPALVGTAKPWTSAAQLRGVLLVDGNADDLPALETCNSGDHSERLLGLAAGDRPRNMAELTVGSYVETCDLIERWFASLDT